MSQKVEELITIIIPTFNRPPFLGRLLYYYTQTECPYPILVSDSSEINHRHENQKLVQSVSQVLNVDYILFDKETNYFDMAIFQSKIIETLKGISTPYVVLCGDDDFIIPNAIDKCVDFLKFNSDYSVASGRILKVQPPSAVSDDLYTTIYPQRNVEDNLPQLRIQNHLENYTSTFYSVHRTQGLLRNMQLTNLYTSEHLFGELLPSCLSIIQGKSRSLDVLYMVRHKRHKESSIINQKKAINSTRKYLEQKEINNWYIKFRACLVSELIALTFISENVAINIVDKAFNDYKNSHFPISNFLIRSLFASRRLIQSIPYLRTEILNRPFRDIASPLQIYRKAYQRYLLDSSTIENLVSPESPFYLDFKQINDCIKGYL